MAEADKNFTPLETLPSRTDGACHTLIGMLPQPRSRQAFTKGHASADILAKRELRMTAVSFNLFWSHRKSERDSGITMSRMTARKIEFEAPDGQSLRFTRVEPSSVTHPEPVLLVHGAGVRGNIFSPPYQESLDSKLARAGYDVWNLDWRASIEHEPNEWTLDKAAVFDYPEAVKKIREETGYAW